MGVFPRLNYQRTNNSNLLYLYCFCGDPPARRTQTA
ncbi:hypothetical protein LEMLEM_LOCUS21306, partial [Lemmus lemmus]